MGNQIDHGRDYDWGKVSREYARYRDIYPTEFYARILNKGLCLRGQKALDVGTGTGVLPRNLYEYGAEWTGIDPSEPQIQQAIRLSEGKKIRYEVMSAEDMSFADHSFDVITACQCYWYFDHEKTSRTFYRVLKPGGHLVLLVMSWLSYEDPIAAESERIVQRYNPDWTGGGEREHPIQLPSCYEDQFEVSGSETFRLMVPFTRDTWNGRMKACRGVGASLSEPLLKEWEAEHMNFLKESAPESFDVLHYGAILDLKRK